MDILQQAVAHLAMLVGFDTSTPQGTQTLREHLSVLLPSMGAVVETIPAATEGAGLIARLGPERPGGVVLSGHLDVVTVTGQAWSSDPFTLARRGERLYGRGCTDMKSFLAACIACIPAMCEAPLQVPIYLVFSDDEETRGLTVESLVRALDQDHRRPAVAIIGEPTEMRVANRHKGAYTYRISVPGRAAHASLDGPGINAITIAARLISWLDDRLAENRRHSTDTQTQTHTTLQVGLINGGNASNIIPDHCEFELDMRLQPGETAEHYLHALAHYAAALLPPGETLHIAPYPPFPPLAPEPGGIAEILVQHLTGANSCISVPFASEAGHFQQAGVSTVVCGPGSAAQAHVPDEFIEVAQLGQCVAFLQRLIQRLSVRGALQKPH